MLGLQDGDGCAEACGREHASLTLQASLDGPQDLRAVVDDEARGHD